MKISFQNLDTNEEISPVWKLNGSQERFWTSPKKIILFSGGYGCLAKDSQIYDAEARKYRKVQDIKNPFKVLSVTPFGIKKAQALAPVRYDKAKIYQVKTNKRKILVTANHQFFSSSNKWVRVSRIQPGEQLQGFLPCLEESISESFLSILVSSVLRWIGKAVDFLTGCRRVFHFRDALPRKEINIFPNAVPLQDDASAHSLKSWHKDGYFFLLKHNHLCQQFYRLSKKSYSCLAGLPVLNGVNHIFSKVSAHTSVINQCLKQFLWNSLVFLNKVVRVFYSPYPNPTIDKEIVQEVKYYKTDYYYDLHVLGTNNYLAEGLFNHNCGKSMMLVLKAVDLSLRYPGNFILMGRKTYVELRDSLIKEFFVLCPPGLIENYSKGELKVTFINKSEIIFRHLDKMMSTEIRSMNLGAAFIDQAEDIPKDVFLAIKGRLRRDCVGDGDRKIFMAINPELTWHYADFKQDPLPGHDLIEASTLENKENLPGEYIQDLMSYPAAYRRQYVEGVWDTSLLAGSIVFDREYQDRLSKQIRAPIKTKEGLKIYKEHVKGHRYQMGIDVAEGSEEETEKKDKSSITIVDLTTEEEVAHWAGQVPPGIVAEKAALFARFYQVPGGEFCTIVPEMNSIGLALVNELDKYDDIHIYRREEFDRSVGKVMKRVGWRTTRASKPLLTTHFQELLRKRNPKVRTRETVEEFKTFIHTSDTNKSGMGAKYGFHDDRIMSLLLAFFQKGEVHPLKILHKIEKGGKIKIDIQPTLIIKNGKARIKGLWPILGTQNKWTTH